jgi:tRNA1Val (adenine37-N6)-methyltransferase
MERIDDLQYNGLKLIQDEEDFCFGTDSVELANFVSGKKGEKAVDIGSGNGIIAVLIAAKKGLNVSAIEPYEKPFSLLQRNIEINALQDTIKAFPIPVQDVPLHFSKGSQAIVVSNPPYYKKGSGELKKGAEFARHELSMTLSDLVSAAAYLLGTGGRFFAIYPAFRMAEFIHCCSKSKLIPKEIVLLGEQAPQLFLCKCIKEAADGVQITVRNAKNYGMQA